MRKSNGQDEQGVKFLMQVILKNKTIQTHEKGTQKINKYYGIVVKPYVQK